MKYRKLKTIFVIFLFVFTIYELLYLHGKYGKLFYIETYLPQPNLPLQLRKEKFTREENGLRILCLIVTAPKYHQTRAVHVAATWARHCSRAVFITSETDINLPDSYVVSGADRYYDLWTKVSKGFEWVYEQNLISSYDWVLKTDDDTFIFMENLITALEPYDPNRLIAAGHKLFTWEENEIYLNGGAGYVLSKASVDHLVSKGLREKFCETNLALGTNEDVNMARCLTYLGVTLVDLRDADGNMQFHVYSPQEQIDPRQAYTWGHLWLKIISVHPYPFGFQSLTSQPISFHYVNAENMYLLYYLTYIVTPRQNEVQCKDREQNSIKQQQRRNLLQQQQQQQQSSFTRWLKHQKYINESRFQ